MNIKLLTKRLKKLRESYGWTQQEVADKIELSRSAITQIEAGNRNISTLELTKFSDLYQKQISFFLSDSEEDEFDVVLFRALPTIANNQNLKHEVDRYINLCSEGLNLQHLLGISGRLELPIYSPGNLSCASDAIKEGEAVAEQERKRLELGNNPIANIAELFSNQNIWASSTDLPKDISGLFLNNTKFGLIILVNANHVIARKRFSYAHEYAHALLDRNRPIQISSLDNKSEFVEMRANAFAAAFLMPAQGIAELLKNINKGQPSRETQIAYDVLSEASQIIESRTKPFSQEITYQDIATIAHHFGVSYQAATYRLRGLNYVSQEKCQELLALEETGRNYLRLLDMHSDLDDQDKKSLWDRELRSEILYLALEAYRREEISRGKLLDLAEMIDVDSSHLLDLINVT